jgi:hypothetical protein
MVPAHTPGSSSNVGGYEQCVRLMAGSNGAQQQQQQQAGGVPPVHSNPVLAAMLSSNSDMPAHNPVLHATMAALSNQGNCTCVYCLTSGSRQHQGLGACRPQQQQQQVAGHGCVMGAGGVGAAAPSSSTALTAAQLASWSMPPPRPVHLPHGGVLAGKPAAAAAAAAAAAGGCSSGFLSSSSSSSGGQQQQQMQVQMPIGSNCMATMCSGPMAPQLPVGLSAAAVEKAAEAAAAAAAAAAAVGGLVGSSDEEHDWGFDVVDLDSLDVTF